MTLQPITHAGSPLDDLTRGVEYRRGAAFLTLLPLLLGLAALAIWPIAFGASEKTVALGLALLAILAAALLRGFWLARPWAPPDLVLAPEGLRVKIGRGVLSLAWSDVVGVETRSFDGYALSLRHRNRIRFDDVTMIRLREGVLERAGLRGRSGPLGQGTDWLLRHGDDGDSVALHHQWLGLPPAEVRGPVEARWRAFAGLDPTRLPPKAAMPPLRLGGFRPQRPERFWAGLLATGAVVGALLTNIAGLWETAGQRQTRLDAERWQAHRAQEREAQRDLSGEADARRRAAEERMQRAFPPRN